MAQIAMPLASLPCAAVAALSISRAVAVAYAQGQTVTAAVSVFDYRLGASSIAANHAISDAKPTLGTPDLLDRLVYGGLLPSLPTHGVAGVTKLDLLHRDDDDVGAAHH